ncbi:MAG TPA: hypothetical protein VJ783_08670 [Pirellulales bacterium]|nr:hypothetical protein [Pirellulales bacterium]
MGKYCSSGKEFEVVRHRDLRHGEVAGENSVDRDLDQLLGDDRRFLGAGLERPLEFLRVKAEADDVDAALGAAVGHVAGAGTGA